jgi:hypothetical protein
MPFGPKNNSDVSWNAKADVGGDDDVAAAAAGGPPDGPAGVEEHPPLVRRQGGTCLGIAPVHSRLAVHGKPRRSYPNVAIG